MKAKPTKKEGEVILQLNRSDEDLLEAASCPPRPAFTIKQVLVPVDFSECSKKALQYAVVLAREHKAAITLLYVEPTTSYALGEYGGINYAALEGDLRANADRDLATLVVDEVRGVVPADTITRSGAPPEAIIDVAKKLPADIIVIATHGRTGLKHVLLGSVAEHVVRKAPCPVLVVREQEREILAK
jgi:universal stress protein A